MPRLIKVEFILSVADDGYDYDSDLLGRLEAVMEHATIDPDNELAWLHALRTGGTGSGSGYCYDTDDSGEPITCTGCGVELQKTGDATSEPYERWAAVGTPDALRCTTNGPDFAPHWPSKN